MRWVVVICSMLAGVSGMAQHAGGEQLLACIDSAAWLGLDSNRYHPGLLRMPTATDRQYSDAALEFLEDVYEGAGIDRMVSYDGVSGVYADRDADLLLDRLKGSDRICALVGELQPQAAGYVALLRQAPGCENALGVLKFNISDPYDVYMHDTNLKRAFVSSWRYLSHGCIRLEKPFLLGELLMDHRLDTVMLNSCLRDQRPVSVALHPRIPVFVIYSTVEASFGGDITWYKDIYHLRP